MNTTVMNASDKNRAVAMCSLCRIRLYSTMHLLYTLAFFCDSFDVIIHLLDKLKRAIFAGGDAMALQ